MLSKNVVLKFEKQRKVSVGVVVLINIRSTFVCIRTAEAVEI